MPCRRAGAAIASCCPGSIRDLTGNHLDLALPGAGSSVRISQRSHLRLGLRLHRRGPTSGDRTQLRARSPPLLPPPHPAATAALSDLLDWVVRASRDEGPRLIQDAGKDGVRAFAPVLRRLRGLVGRPSRLPQDPDHCLRACGRLASTRAFTVLHDQLRRSDPARRAGAARPGAADHLHVTTDEDDRPDEFTLTGANSPVLPRRSWWRIQPRRHSRRACEVRHGHQPNLSERPFRIPRQGPDASRANWQLVFINGDGTQSYPFAVQI